MEIKDTRIDKEAKKDRDAQEEAEDILMFQVVTDAPNVPGAWIKKYGSRFKHLKDLKAKHFNHRIK